MDNIPIDRDMAHVILKAFSVACHEAQSSLIDDKPPMDNLGDCPSGKTYGAAEVRVLRVINVLYPEIVGQYFDMQRQQTYDK